MYNLSTVCTNRTLFHPLPCTHGSCKSGWKPAFLKTPHEGMAPS